MTSVMEVASMTSVMEDLTHIIYMYVCSFVIQTFWKQLWRNYHTNNNSTISSKQAGTQAKRKSPADVLESHLKQKSENQADRKVLMIQRAVRVQLK